MLGPPSPTLYPQAATFPLPDPFSSHAAAVVTSQPFSLTPHHTKCHSTVQETAPGLQHPHARKQQDAGSHRGCPMGTALLWEHRALHCKTNHCPDPQCVREVVAWGGPSPTLQGGNPKSRLTLGCRSLEQSQPLCVLCDAGLFKRRQTAVI